MPLLNGPVSDPCQPSQPILTLYPKKARDGMPEQQLKGYQSVKVTDRAQLCRSSGDHSTVSGIYPTGRPARLTDAFVGLNGDGVLTVHQT